MGNYVVFVCDKCGKESKLFDMLLPVWVLAPDKHDWFNVNLHENEPTMQLCEKCREEFKAYVDAWKKKEGGNP